MVVSFIIEKVMDKIPSRQEKGDFPEIFNVPWYPFECGPALVNDGMVRYSGC
jgi:hypothetical protein